MLAAAFGHRLARRCSSGIHGFRVGTWYSQALAEMLALRFAASHNVRADGPPAGRGRRSLHDRHHAPPLRPPYRRLARATVAELAWTGREIRVFSYPFGRWLDYNRKS